MERHVADAPRKAYGQVIDMIWIMCALSVMIVPSAPFYDDDNLVALEWGAASGNVDHYEVLGSLNDGAFSLMATTTTAAVSFYLDWKPGHKLIVKVQALDVAGNRGPESEASDPRWRVVDKEAPQAPIGR